MYFFLNLQEDDFQPSIWDPQQKNLMFFFQDLLYRKPRFCHITFPRMENRIPKRPTVSSLSDSLCGTWILKFVAPPLEIKGDSIAEPFWNVPNKTDQKHASKTATLPLWSPLDPSSPTHRRSQQWTANSGAPKGDGAKGCLRPKVYPPTKIWKCTNECPLKRNQL